MRLLGMVNLCLTLKMLAYCTRVLVASIFDDTGYCQSFNFTSFSECLVVAHCDFNSHFLDD